MRTSDSAWFNKPQASTHETWERLTLPVSKRDRALWSDVLRWLPVWIACLGSSCLFGMYGVWWINGTWQPLEPKPAGQVEQTSTGSGWLAATAVADPRLERIARLSSDEQRELLRKKDAFYRLPVAEQQSYRDFHDRLSKHPQAPRLLGILHRYYNWLKTLDERTKSALLDNPDKSVTISKIRELRETQNRQVSFLPESDHQQFDTWLKALGERKAEEVKQSFREFRRRSQLATELTESSSPDLLIRIMLRADRSGETMRRLVSSEDLEQLKSSLSDAAKSIMNEEKVRSDFVLFNFIRNPYVSPDELEQFYFKELTSEQRDELDKMPPDQMKNRLRLMFQLKQIGMPKEQWLRGLNNDNRRR